MSIPNDSNHSSLCRPSVDDRERIIAGLLSLSPSCQYHEPAMPAELVKRQQSLHKQIRYHLTQVWELADQAVGHRQDLQDWANAAHCYEPRDVIGMPEFANYYPALVMGGHLPVNLLEEQPACEAEQRWLTTELLRGTISAKKKQELLNVSHRLVCSMDPQMKDFFSDSQVRTCLIGQGLSTDAAINEFMGRKPYIPVTKSDRRDALKLKWKQRDRENLIRYRLSSGDYGDDHELICSCFTLLLLAEVGTVTLPYIKYFGPEIAPSLWQIYLRSEDRNHYEANPNDDDWVWRLYDFAVAWEAHLKECDETHVRPCPDQWVKNVGASLFFGVTHDWWKDLEDVPRWTEEANVVEHEFLCEYRESITNSQEGLMIRDRLRDLPVMMLKASAEIVLEASFNSDKAV